MVVFCLPKNFFPDRFNACNATNVLNAYKNAPNPYLNWNHGKERAKEIDERSGVLKLCYLALKILTFKMLRVCKILITAVCLHQPA